MSSVTISSNYCVHSHQEKKYVALWFLNLITRTVEGAGNLPGARWMMSHLDGPLFGVRLQVSETLLKV